MIKFGPSGTGERFHQEGYVNTCQAGGWLKNQNIDLFEYSFGRGVNLKQETAIAIGDSFKNNGIELSIHAPYFINFATPDDDKAKNSYNYVIDTAKMAKIMGAYRIVFHPASQGKESREVTVERTKERLKILSDMIQDLSLNDIKFCPETMGKIVQIGTIEEVVDFCKISDIYMPTVDFGHVNAREQGSLKTKNDFLSRIKYMIDELGFDRIKHFHVHFSKIQYSSKGEIKHLNFDDKIFGPEFEPFIDACLELGVEPHVICESAGNQTDDSISMKNYYLSKNNK